MQAKLRLEVYDRDRGVCALCHLSCAELREHLFQSFGYDPGHLWEADHEVPLALGGDDLLSNLRTLCLDCHDDETDRVIHGGVAHRGTPRLAALSIIAEDLREFGCTKVAFHGCVSVGSGYDPTAMVGPSSGDAPVGPSTSTCSYQGDRL